MPNWCSNKLTVSGEAKEIIRFREAARGEDTGLSLNNLYPMPEELEKDLAMDSVVRESDPTLIGKYGYDNALEWCNNNWGTKWDVDAVLVCEVVGESDGVLQYMFPSSWRPPVSWLEKVCKDYPKLYFLLKYDEEDMRFMGVAIAEDGELEDKRLHY